MVIVTCNYCKKNVGYDPIICETSSDDIFYRLPAGWLIIDSSICCDKCNKKRTRTVKLLCSKCRQKISEVQYFIKYDKLSCVLPKGCTIDDGEFICEECSNVTEVA